MPGAVTVILGSSFDHVTVTIPASDPQAVVRSPNRRPIPKPSSVSRFPNERLASVVQFHSFV